jgi:hypothetical protein
VTWYALMLLIWLKFLKKSYSNNQEYLWNTQNNLFDIVDDWLRRDRFIFVDWFDLLLFPCAYFAVGVGSKPHRYHLCNFISLYTYGLASSYLEVITVRVFMKHTYIYFFHNSIIHLTQYSVKACVSIAATRSR